MEFLIFLAGPRRGEPPGELEMTFQRTQLTCFSRYRIPHAVCPFVVQFRLQLTPNMSRKKGFIAWNSCACLLLRAEPRPLSSLKCFGDVPKISVSGVLTSCPRKWLLAKPHAKVRTSCGIEFFGSIVSEFTREINHNRSIVLHRGD